MREAVANETQFSFLDILLDRIPEKSICIRIWIADRSDIHRETYRNSSLEICLRSVKWTLCH